MKIPPSHIAYATLAAIAVSSCRELPEARRDAGSRGPAILALNGMSSSRAAHSATLLQDGRVLIAGGCTAPGCDEGVGSDGLEVYDPATRTFSFAGRMSRPRSGHTATFVPCIGVVIAGGWSGSTPTDDIDIYDPLTGRITRASSTLLTRRGAHTATALASSGGVLIAGGTDGERMLNSVVLIDSCGTSFEGPPMVRGRSAHTATMLRDGRVLVTGGSTARGTVTASCEIFDPVAGSWTETAPMSVRRHKHAAILLADGRVLVAGGSDERDFQSRHSTAEIFDPVANRFVETLTLQDARFKFPDAIAVLADGTIVFAGGSRIVESFNPVTRGVSALGDTLDAARMFSTATTLVDGNVLVTGGYDTRINPTAKAWLIRQ